MVFTTCLDRDRHPLRSRRDGIVIGTMLLLSVTAGLVSPRTLAVTVPIVGLLVIAIASRASRPSFTTLTAPLSPHYFGFLFLGFALLSAMWAMKPLSTISAVILASGYIAICLIASTELVRIPRPLAYHVAEGLWLGLAIGAVYLAIEILSNQAIRIFFYKFFEMTISPLRPPTQFTWDGSTLVGISPADLTRSIAPIPPLLWASLLALRTTAPFGQARLWSWLLFGLCVFVVAISAHETSKIAIVVGASIFAVSRWRAAVSDRALKLFWVLACLVVVPATLALHRIDAQSQIDLQYSLRHRIVIWNHTAEQALKVPIIGIGAKMMYYRHREWTELDEVTVRNQTFDVRSPHAHNIYLQTWLKLGVVGATLLTLTGLAIIERLGKLHQTAVPYAHASFVSLMVLGAGSYGMWQAWFIAMFALSAIAFAACLRVSVSDGDNLNVNTNVG